jgi:hypothetical protein
MSTAAGHPGDKDTFAPVILALALALLACGPARAEPWWRTATPVASVRLQLDSLETVQPGAARGVDTLGWYGFWFLDAGEAVGLSAKPRGRLRAAGVKNILYYDLGEVGDYAGFFAPDGRMAFNAWSLPWWKGDVPLTARWFGLEAFMADVPWAPFPSAKAYGLPPFTLPSGEPATNLYAALARRSLEGEWRFDYDSNARITDDQAARSGLAALAGRQSARADIQGKTGWQTVRLVDVDYANPQLSAYCCREVERLVQRLRPDGIHADNLGDNNLGYASQGAFGLWSQHTFRDYLRRHFSPAELARLGVTNVAAFDIASYIRDKPFESRGERWQILNPKWAEDPLWLCYLVNKVQTSQAYHRAFYDAAKRAAREAGIECAVFGNAIPLPLGGSLMKGACDIAHFEWSTAHGWWNMRAAGLPPQGRLGYVSRLGAAMSDAGYCWPSVYVSQELSGAAHTNLHLALAFDALANRGLLDFGHWYRDGYSPGAPESAGLVNRFVRDNAALLSGRRYLADVAVVHSAWSEIASSTVFNPACDLFVDEYCGWCQYLGDSHRQWDVLLQADLSAERLSRYPIVVLPSVLALTDRDAEALRAYAAAGGRVIATGLTGTRYGPEGHLWTREQPLRLDGARVAADKPGAAYWRKDRDPAAAARLSELLTFQSVAPRLSTDAPMNVGVNMNLDRAGCTMTLDLNNVDLDVATDTLRASPPIAVTLRLPDGWKGVKPQITCSRPEGQIFDLPSGAASYESDKRTLRLQLPSFQTMLLVRVAEGSE